MLQAELHQLAPSGPTGVQSALRLASLLAADISAVVTYNTLLFHNIGVF